MHCSSAGLIVAGFFSMGGDGLGLTDVVVSTSVGRQVGRVLEADPCVACGCFNGIKSPKLGITGEGRLGVLYMGEAQGGAEDEQGRQFVGEAGGLLRTNLMRLGLDFERDFFALNAVRCRTCKVSESTGRVINRTPTDREIALCHAGTWALVKALQPRAIWLAGGVALQSYLLGKMDGKLVMTKWRGFVIPDWDLGCWVLPMYHPSYLLRNKKDKALASLFAKDLAAALSVSEPMGSRVVVKPELVYGWEDAVAILERVAGAALPTAVDFETTGLRPYAAGHDIWYASVSNSEVGYSFRTEHAGVRAALAALMANSAVPKIGHNMKFEHLWARHILGVETVNWYWDTMQAAHVLDCRQGITSLGFQIAVRYGDWSFKHESDPYLKAAGPNGINRIAECPPNIIMQRNALDAAYEFRLACDQWGSWPPGLTPAYNLFHAGALALEKAEHTGIRCDDDYYNRIAGVLEGEKAALVASIRASEPGQRFSKRVGKEINPGSDDQVRTALFKCCGVTPTGRVTGKVGRASVDSTALEQVAKGASLEVAQFCRAVLRYNKVDKLLGTYVNGYRGHSVGGFLHPSFNLHLVRTYRSSSDNPNFQNVPVRDEEAKQTIRAGLFPHRGQRWLSADYSGMEVRIAACYTGDVELIRYVSNPLLDMHRDQAAELFLVAPDLVTKPLRQVTKGNWVFAQFYGSWWKPCAADLWVGSKDLELADGTPVREHLASQGVRRLETFEEHVKAHEYNFWRRFAGYARWKRDVEAQYLRTGSVDMFHGFRRTGLLGRNEILNSPIQGTAFHCLLWSFIELTRVAEEEGWASRLMGEVHDDIAASVQPEEADYIMQMFRWVMCEAINTPHPWLVVPLDIEIEMGGVDRPWVEKQPVK